MQQYDVNKKKMKVSLVVRYIIMTVAVVAISVICVLLALGYSFDLASRKVEQGALIQFATSPTGAQIHLDGEQLAFNTNGKREAKAGAHTLMYRKDGYRDWTKDFTIKAGEVRWLNYARLVPTTIDTSVVKEIGTLSSQLPSPNKKYIAYLAKADSPEITVVKLDNPKEVSSVSIVIPPEMIKHDAVGHVYTISEWNLASKYLLVKHEYTGGKEYIRINVEDVADIVNVSAKLGVALDVAHFSKESVFYGIENGNLRKIDIGAGTLSEPLVNNVVDIKLYGSDDIAYVRYHEARYEVGIVLGNSKPRTVNTYDDTVPLLIDTSKYFNERYLAITRGSSFELIKNPEKDAEEGMKKIATMTYPIDLKWLDISSNGRFVIMGSGARFATYDIELAISSESNFPNLLSDPKVHPRWLDDYMLVSTGDNKLRISDYDGTNQQIIVDALPGQPVMLSGDGKLLYSFSKSNTGVVTLQASKMTVEK